MKKSILTAIAAIICACYTSFIGEVITKSYKEQLAKFGPTEPVEMSYKMGMVLIAFFFAVTLILMIVSIVASRREMRRNPYIHADFK